MVKNARRHVWEEIKEKVCSICSAVFKGKSYETWCPKCEAERRKRTYTECADSDGWQKLPCGGHMRRTHGADTW